MFVAGLNSPSRNNGDMSGYMSDGDLVRSRSGGHHPHGQPGHGVYGGYTSDNTYNDPGYISDNHYDRSVEY